MKNINVVTLLTLVLSAPAHAQSCDAYYPFDGNLADVSGNGYHGLPIIKEADPGAPQFVEGKIGQALHITGGNAMRAFIDLHYDTCPQVSVTAWFKLESVDARGNQYIISTGSGSGPGIRAQGRTLRMNGTANGISQRDAIRDNNTWFFLAGVYDYAADSYKLYWRNRAVEGTLSENRRPPEDSFWVGTFNDGMSHTAQSLYVDDLRIHGRALSAEEIRSMATGVPQAAAQISNQFGTDVPRLDADDLPERPPDLLSGNLNNSTESVSLLEVPDEVAAANSGQTEPNLAILNEDSLPDPGIDYDRSGPIVSGEEDSLQDRLLDGLRQRDYIIAQVNSQVAETHRMFGMDLPLAVRVQVSNAADDDNIVFYAGIGQPGSDDPILITDRYEGQGSGPHIVTLDVPLDSPFVAGDEFKADLFLLGEKQMQGLPGQSITLKTPIEDADASNNRESLNYEVHRPKGYVLTHEHPTYGMAFGGNYAFAGGPGNYRNGIMQQGYHAECGGCKVLGMCDHGEVKGSFVAAIGSLGRDMGDHSHQMGPFHNSNSHLRYATDWIEEAYKPTETELQDARMRIMVAFAVENEAMCEQIYYVNKGNGGPGGDGYQCSNGDSWASLKRQLDNLKAWAAENSSWMEIAYTASDARRIVNDDKLAIILGVEAEYAFGAENRTFDPVKRLNDFYDEGVRTFYLAHKINSRLAGADIYFPASSQAGKAIRTTQAISGCFYYDDNVAHFPLEGRLGNKLCDNNCGANAFKGGKITDACATRLGQISEINMADYVLTRGGGQFNGFALYPWTAGFDGQGGSRVVNGIERNNLGLSHDGERVVRQAMLKGMIVNIDHVSSIARDEMHALATDAFDNYPLNALHNKPNHMLTNGKGFWRHEYDLANNELDYVKDTGGFFGFRMGPTDSIEFPEAGVNADCPNTSTESAKMLAWLVKRGLPVGYALDFATTTQGVHSRTMEECGLNIGTRTDEIHKYGSHTAEGISHVGMMKKWHKELESIGLDQQYVDALKNDGVEAFLQMWEKSEAASDTGGQITRTVFGGANPQVH